MPRPLPNAVAAIDGDSHPAAQDALSAGRGHDGDADAEPCTCAGRKPVAPREPAKHDRVVHVHLEAHGTDLHVWLGLPVTARAGGALMDLLLHLQREKALPIARLVCNGKVEFETGGPPVNVWEDS